jgi:hypothetical protein
MIILGDEDLFLNEYRGCVAKEIRGLFLASWPSHTN